MSSVQIYDEMTNSVMPIDLHMLCSSTKLVVRILNTFANFVDEF
jgi:hypothetical protein